jgi:glycosyltransferase involved in cell wall biosynthesis
VHVPTFERAAFLPTLVERLADQTIGTERFEVVIVDNGSRDDTWAVLSDLLARSPLRLRIVRVPVNRGPAAARNVAVAASRAPLLAFTDDDCLPTAKWLEEVVEASRDADVVQGRTEPDPSQTSPGAWDRTIRIVDETPLFETCNIAYWRTTFDEVGGFDEHHAIAARPGGRAFGEDVLLGDAVVARGGRRAFAPEAIVHHRYLPGTFAGHVREMRNLAGFPALASETRVVADALWHRVFLTRRTASFDLAALAAMAALALRRPGLLAACTPWVVQTLPLTREHGGRHAAVRLVQLALVDAVGAASLLEGSIRYRRLVL